MEIKNISFTLKNNCVLMLLIAATLVTGCAQKQRRGDTTRVPVIAGGQTTQPEIFDDNGDEPEPPKPIPAVSSDVPPRVAVLLGPGGYRAFAHATILKEFARARIPVEKVVGFEWGALAGAFFALDGKAHEAEWKLYKLDKKDLESQGFFSRKDEPQSMKALQKYLNENFAKRDLSGLKVKFTCPSLSLQNGTVSFFEK